MEKHAEDARRKAMVIDIDMLVPKDHLLRKIEKVMDYDWLYERLNPLYNNKVGRPGTDPVVLIKMVLIQHLFGIPSLRQTWRECDVNVAYRWFLGYDLLEHIPHFATVSYAFCNRFPPELSVEIFDHILCSPGLILRCTLEIEFVSCDIPTTENGCACIGMMTSLAADSAFVSRSPTEGEQSMMQ